MDGPIVAARNLTKKFKDLPAVNGISFALSRGECFGFLGPNGAGKTTTIKMIHCVSPKTAGELLVFGQEASINNRAIKQKVGVIPQENNLDADLTVYENLLLFANFFDIDRHQAGARIRELLAFVGLEGKRDNKIDELSVGMKRRLLVARSLINQPELIIADEPTTGLDPQARHLIWQRLRELKTKGVTLVLTTQYMEEAAQLCDRLVVMYQGKILKEGAPDNLVEEEIGREVVEVRIGEERDAGILQALEGEKFEHERVGDTLYFYSRDGRSLLQKIMALDLPKVLHRPASLEDVFLKLTGRSLTE